MGECVEVEGEHELELGLPPMLEKIKTKKRGASVTCFGREGETESRSKRLWCTHSPLLVVLDLGVGLKTEPLGNRSVLSSGFRKTGLDSEGLLGRLEEQERTKGKGVSVRFEVDR